MTDPVVPNHPASRYLLCHRTQIAQELAEHIFCQKPQLRTLFGSYGLVRAKQVIEIQLETLANTLAFETPSVFARDLMWFEAELERVKWDGIKGLGFETVLGEARRFLRERHFYERAKQVDGFIEKALRYRVDTVDSSHYLDDEDPFGELGSRLLEMLLSDQREAASALMLAVMRAGVDLGELYTHALQPVQYEVGRRWEIGEISQAQEHFCTAAILSIMAELFPYAEPSPAVAGEPTLVLAMLGDEPHMVGGRMLKDLLSLEGWRVGLLVRQVTAASVKQALEKWEADVLALSVTMSSQLLETEQIIASVRASPTVGDVKVMVGGRPFVIDDTLWSKVGADGTAADISATVQLAGRLYDRRREDDGEQAWKPRRPVASIWWRRNRDHRWRWVRDGLGLRAAEADGERRMEEVLDEVMKEGSARQIALRSDAGGKRRDQKVWVDVVQRNDAQVAAVAMSTSKLESAIDEGCTTLKAIEEVLNRPSFTDVEGRAAGRRSARGVSELYAELTLLQRELALKELNMEAEQRDQDALLAMLAHDMRNALTLIDANSYFLRQLLGDQEIPEEVFDHLEAIASRSNLVLELVGDLQELARLGQADIDKRSVELRTLIEEAVQNARAAGAKKEIDVRFAAPEDTMGMAVDPTLIRRLLDNLLSNALKFSPPHTEVEVAVGLEEEAIYISVTDQGPGIPEKELEQLYDLFFLGSARSTAGEKRMGLGLPIVKRIVDAHGGRIEVDTELGKGTTFVVRLPIEP